MPIRPRICSPASSGSPQREEFCRLVGTSADPTRALTAASDELHETLGELETVLAGRDGPVRSDETGDLVVSPLSAEDVPLRQCRSRPS